MDYRKIYIKIIVNAKKEADKGLRPKRIGDKKYFNEYYEFHHILPKSLFPLWEKRESNLIALTAREHFFCHQLLTKIYPCSKMACAVIKMMYNVEKHIGSRDYERIRKRCGELLKGENNPFYGKTHSEESRRKNAEWHHLHPYSKEVYDKIHEKNRGQHRTPEQRKRQSEAALKRDNSKSAAQIKYIKSLYEKYRNEGGILVWNDFQKHYKEYAENGII